MCLAETIDGRRRMMGRHERKIVFPFTAIVGQENARLALLSCAVDPTIGGVLLSGDKGTGKSTLVRALTQALPEIEVVDGCPFNCNPRNPLEMCDSCYEKLVSGDKLETVKRKMKVVDLPLSITVDSLVGTIDIKKAIKEGVRALQPGLLAEANRNILYIDEVNLLDDYVADILLDAAAMGWNIIEREGISFRHPARFILVGSMNPEEGELRPQLLDRFGLYVPVEALTDPEERIEIVRRVEEFHADPVSFYRKYEGRERQLRETIVRAKELVKRTVMDDDLLKLLIDTIIRINIKTHRAEITTVKTAKAIAALNGRTRVTYEDLKKAMELALPHRLKSRPFQPPQIPDSLTDHHHKPGGEASTGEMKRGRNNAEPNFNQDSPGGRELTFKASDVDVSMKPNRENGRLSNRSMERGSKNYRVTVIGHPHGYQVSYMLPLKDEYFRDIDLVATINAAALRQRGLPLKVEESDVRVRVRKRRKPELSVIVLDSSGSMGVQKRMSIAKGIAQKLIEKSYVNRDYVALITFRGRSAEITVPPTRNYQVILKMLDRLPTGGRTPLPSALQTLLHLAKTFRMKNVDALIRGILITDGKANVPLHTNVKSDVENLASMLAKSGVKIEIHDTRPPASVELAPSYVEHIAELANAQVYRYS